MTFDGKNQTTARFHIRPASLGDAQRLAVLANQLSYSSTPQQVVLRLRALHQSHEQAVFVAADPGDQAIGFVHVQVRHAIEHDSRGELVALVVDEQIRSRGVGRLLMEAAEAWVRNQGLTTIVLRSNVTRERAHAFYERLGYRHTKSQKFFVKDFSPKTDI
jgi:GNAT superfamily N-acetyltransferase